MTDKKTMSAMKQHLEWNRHDVTTISAMADLLAEEGDDKKSAEMRLSAQAASQVTYIQSNLAALEKYYVESKKELEKALSKARKGCEHSVTKYYPDASGNNDSWYECLCCGANL